MVMGEGKLVTIPGVSPDTTLPTLNGIIALKRASEHAASDASESVGATVQTLVNRIAAQTAYANTTAGNRPTKGQDADGDFYLEFDGSTDYYSRTQPLTALPATRIMVLSLPAPLAGAMVFAGAEIGSSLILGKGSTGTFTVNNGAVLDTGVTAGTAKVVIGGVFNGTSSFASLNGTTNVAGNAGSTAMPTTTRIGRGSSSTVYRMRLYHEMIYARALTARQLQDTCLLLAAKYHVV